MALESKHLKFSAFVVLMAWVFARSVFAAEFPQPDFQVANPTQSVLTSR